MWNKGWGKGFRIVWIVAPNFLSTQHDVERREWRGEKWKSFCVLNVSRDNDLPWWFISWLTRPFSCKAYIVSARYILVSGTWDTMIGVSAISPSNMPCFSTIIALLHGQ